MTQRYVSNFAVNGSYVSGSNGNAGTSEATAYLSLMGTGSNGAVSHVASSGDTLTLNPTSTSITSADHPYAEIAAISLGTRSMTLQGDPAYTSWTGSIKVAVIQSSFATYLAQNSGTSGTLIIQDLVFDLQNTASKIGFYGAGGAFANLILRRVRIVNCPSTGHPFQGYAGACNITLEDCTVDSTCLYGSGGWFNCSGVTSGSLTINGGTYAGTVSQGKIFNLAGSSWTNITVQNYSGSAPAISAGAWFMQANTVTGTINLNAAACNNAYQLINLTPGATVGSLNIRNTTFTCGASTSTNVPFVVGISESVTLGEFSNNTFTDFGNSTAYALQINNGVGTPLIHDNVILYNGPNHAMLIGTDEDTIDQGNATASTGDQKIGDVSGNTYVDQIVLATTAIGFQTTISQTYHSSYVTGFVVKLKKTGTPTGTLTAEIYADSAGVPGTLINSCTNNIDASQLTTGYLFYYFDCNPVSYVAPGSKIHLVIQYTGTNNNTDYVLISRNGTVGLGSIQASQDGVTWTASPTICLNFWLLTGAYGITDPEVYSNVISSTFNSNAAIAHMIAMGGSIRGAVYDNAIYGGSLGVMFKGTHGGTALNPAQAYNNLIYQPYGGFGSVAPLLTKGAEYVTFANNTIISGATSYGYAVKIAPTTTGLIGTIQNHIQSDHIVVENNILVQSASATTQPLFALNKTAMGVAPTNITINNNCDYLPNGGYFGVVYNMATDGSFTVATNYTTFAAWQAAGYDVDGINADPVLPTLTPTQATSLAQYGAQFTPAHYSPVIGAGTTAITSTDYFGVAWTDPATMGAINAMVVGAGRMEFTMPRSTLDFTMPDERLEFTLLSDG